MPRGTDRYDEARLQRRLWTPMFIRGSLVAWYDFIDASSLTFASGSLVSGIKDKSGNGFDLSQATGGKQPTWSTQALNFSPGTGNKARPGLLCNGTEIYSSSSITIGPSCAGFAAFNYTTGSSPAFGRILGMGATATGTDNSIISFLLSSGSNNIGGFNSSVGFLSTTTPNGSTGQAHVASSILNGTNHTIRCDGNPGTPVAISGSFTGYPRIIGNGDASDFNGALSEALIVNGDVSAGGLYYKIEGYLAWKWGTVDQLIASHPYKNRPPTIGG